MTQRQLKTGYFVLTALNTAATTYFFNFLFFYLRDRFQFGNRLNLWMCAMHGSIYIFSAWQCGRYAERRGFLHSLKVGFGGLAVLMVVGGLSRGILGIICTLIGYSVVLLFTWPALEALVAQHESRAGVQHNIGVYNCTWAAASAFAYFTGGKLYDMWGRGAVFWLPAAMFAGQFLMVQWLAREAARAPAPRIEADDSRGPRPDPAALRQRVSPRGFLILAWLANPFSFMAVDTIYPVIPSLARKLELSPTQAGVFCSIWMFGRLAAFVACWRWTHWQYRFRWLLGSYLALVGGFMLMVLSGSLWLVVAAQVFFGLATGLIYYSSLFYSMDVGDTKGEHGGLHEAALGAGIFAGPAVGAASLQFVPSVPNIGVLAVSGLLLAGLAALLGIWNAQRK